MTRPNGGPAFRTDPTARRRGGRQNFKTGPAHARARTHLARHHNLHWASQKSHMSALANGLPACSNAHLHRLPLQTALDAEAADRGRALALQRYISQKWPKAGEAHPYGSLAPLN